MVALTRRDGVLIAGDYNRPELKFYFLRTAETGG